ncbi:MAG TPA: proline-rich domain-containing protein [Nakamurella sp.]
MSEHGGPQGPGQGRPAGGPPPQGPWQGPNGPQGWPQPGQGPQNPGGQSYGAPNYGAPNYGGQPAGPQGWQPSTGPQAQQPTGPQGWHQPSTQTFPPQGPGGPGQPPNQPWNVQGPGTPEPKKSKTPLIVALVVVVALVAAAGVWFFALRDKNSTTATAGGESTPQESVTALFSTLSNSDPIGLADQLDPAEAALFTDLNTDIITELKRLEVLSPQASADTMTGTKITVKDLTFAGDNEVINDHLQIVKLTGGTITVESNPTDLPLSDKIKDAFGSELDQVQPQSETVNIAEEVADNDGEPFRIATVKRGDQWYVSFFYSVADNATHAAGLPNPTAADAIAAQGSDSPEAAVDKLIDAATTGDLTTVIAVTPPDEMGALHDYGKLLLQQADAGSLEGDMQDLGFTIDDVTWDVSDVTGGKKVSIKSATITAEGQTITIERDPAAGSLTVSAPGQPAVTIDDDTIETYIAQYADTSDLDPQAIEIIKREFKQIIGLGLVTVQVDGQWYVSPVRSFGDVFTSLLKGLEPADVDYLITLAGN